MLLVLARHRGPFLFMVGRKNKKGEPTTEWLRGDISKECVEEEALLILEDPRDNVDHISVWSSKEEQFITILKIKDLRGEEVRAA